MTVVLDSWAILRLLDDDHPSAATAVANGAGLWTGDPELLLDGSRLHWRDLRES